MRTLGVKINSNTFRGQAWFEKRFFGSKMKMSTLTIGALKNMVRQSAEVITNRSAERHIWANKLGAKPTGALVFSHNNGKAHSKTGGLIGFSSGSRGAGSFFITGLPFIKRFLKSFIIKPKKAKYLAIPIHKAAYQKRPSEVNQFGKKFVIQSKNGNKFIVARKTIQEEKENSEAKSDFRFAMRNGKRVKLQKTGEEHLSRKKVFLFILKKSVEEPRDWRMFPNRRELTSYAKKGIIMAFKENKR